MGVPTHLDGFRDSKQLLQDEEAAEAALLGRDLPGCEAVLRERHQQRAVPRTMHNLALFISRMKFRPSPGGTITRTCSSIASKTSQTAVLQDDEHARPPLAMYGYLRGSYLREGVRVHVPGAGITRHAQAVEDPRPQGAGRGGQDAPLTQREGDPTVRADVAVGGVIYDKDAMYISLGKINYTRSERSRAAWP